MGFFSATLEPRQLMHKVVGQERFLRQVEAIGSARITTISAPPGYGKTVAMVQWTEALSRGGRQVIWISARAGIADCGEFTEIVRKALQRAGLELPDTSAPLAEIAATLTQKLVLAIDDSNLLPDDVQHMIGNMVELSSPMLSVILAFRGKSRIAFARLQALGLLCELDTTDLRFTYADMAEFLATNSLVSVDEAAFNQLFKDTKGWAAGIAMAAARLRKLDSPPAAAAISRIISDIENYFEEEVLAAQPEDIQNYLTDTAILEEMTPAACTAITGREDIRPLMKRLEEAGLFIETADREHNLWLYHPLFRTAIQRRLSPPRASELHRRASVYYASRDAIRAVEHAALTGDQEFLADQLEALSETLTYNGFLYRIEELCSTLTEEVKAKRPMLLLALGWRSVRRLSFSSAEKLIEAATQRTEKMRAEGLLDARRYELICRHIAHRWVMLDAARDDMPKVEQAAEKLLLRIGDSDVYLSCTLLAQLMAARRDLYHFQDMKRLEAEIRRVLGLSGSSFASIALKAAVAPTLVVQGKTDVGRKMLEESLEMAHELHGRIPGLAALPGLPLSELLYECGELDAARSLVDEHMDAARHWGFVDQLAAGYLVRAKLNVAEGNYDLALAGLEEANLVAIECGLERLRALIMAERVRILIRAGDHLGAQQLFQSSGLAPDGEPLPTLNPNGQSEIVAIAWLRLEIKANRLQRARKVASRWCELARRTGVARSVVVFELLLAEIMVLSGNRSEARSAVRNAVVLASQAGWTRIFFDEGEVIGLLLTEAYGHGPILDTVPDRFAARLAVAFKGGAALQLNEDFGLGGKLANRELDILSMVAGGLRNREIGDRLGLTEGTVKWYMQQIYDKLGVRRRPQAVIRARQLGVLH